MRTLYVNVFIITCFSLYISLNAFININNSSSDDDDETKINFIHASPYLGDIDIYLDGSCVAKKVEYLNQSSFSVLNPNKSPHLVQLYKSGGKILKFATNVTNSGIKSNSLYTIVIEGTTSSELYKDYPIKLSKPYLQQETSGWGIVLYFSVLSDVMVDVFDSKKNKWWHSITYSSQPASYSSVSDGVTTQLTTVNTTNPSIIIIPPFNVDLKKNTYSLIMAGIIGNKQFPPQAQYFKASDDNNAD